LDRRQHIKLIEDEGWKYFTQGAHDLSIKSWDELFDKEADNIAAFQGKIACLRKKHNFTGAKQLLDKALISHPRHLGILCERAWLNLDQKQYDAAIDSFNKVLAVEYKNEDILLWKIFLLRNCRRFDEARTIHPPYRARLQRLGAWVDMRKGSKQLRLYCPLSSLARALSASSDGSIFSWGFMKGPKVISKRHWTRIPKTPILISILHGPWSARTRNR
jgi:tetratricopeptide (TPR) repeat protein